MTNGTSIEDFLSEYGIKVSKLKDDQKRILLNRFYEASDEVLKPNKFLKLALRSSLAVIGISVTALGVWLAKEWNAPSAGDSAYYNYQPWPKAVPIASVVASVASLPVFLSTQNKLFRSALENAKFETNIRRYVEGNGDDFTVPGPIKEYIVSKYPSPKALLG